MTCKQPSKEDLRIGKRIELARKSMCLTQKELGTRCNLSFQNVYNYESGSVRVYAARLANIAKALQRPISYFFDEEVGTESNFVPDKTFEELQQAYLKVHPEDRQQILVFTRLMGQRLAA